MKHHRAKNHLNTNIKSILSLSKPTNKLDVEQLSIYQGTPSSGSIGQPQEKIQSSFQLEDRDAPVEQNHQNLQKLLDRLGLKRNGSAESKNQQLEIIVNNFVQNCIGTIDKKANTQEYDKIYDQKYRERLKQLDHPVSSIYISELTQLQKLQNIEDKGLKIIYKKVRILLKYISMLCEKIVMHPIFQGFILVVILLNSMKMATDDPLATTTSLPQVQLAFTFIYVTQMSLKIIAFGFIFNQKSYLRDLWNVMDFCIVLTSLLPLFMSIGFSVSALRAVRVLRPLKAITKIKALKQIIRTLFYSFSLVMDSLYVLIFIMFFFAIAGMQLFGGNLKQACMQASTGIINSTAICSATTNCPSDFLCVKGISSPNYSILNFDTILWAFLSVFQIITEQGWSLIMIYVQQTSGFIYCLHAILVIMICQNVILNMTMAILKYKYAQVKSNTIEEQQEEKQEYQPQFLKKIGIYDNMSVLALPAPLVRVNDRLKLQIGCSSSLPIEQNHLSISTEQLLKHFDAPKISQKIAQEKDLRINIEELKQMGKIQDYKWDVNNLQFETNELYIEGAINEDKERNESEKTIGIKDKQSNDEDSFDSSEMEDVFSDEDSEQFEKQQELTDKATEMQIKLNGTNINISATGKIVQSQKIFQAVPVQKKQKKVTKEISELDKLLQLIGSKPGVAPKNLGINIPDIQLDSQTAERIYERFGDLGDYGIKKISNLDNALKSISIPNIKKMAKKDFKKSNLLKETTEEVALDLKQLHLKNELLKLELRCRVKPDEMIDLQRKYDYTRVIVSQKIKEVQKKKQEIRQNMQSLRFQVRYKLPLEKNEVQASIFSRNLNNPKKLLKIPEFSNTEAKIPKSKREQINTKTQKFKQDNNQYLKMLQNHQLEQKVELKLDRIMHTFFKETSNKTKVKKEKFTAQEEYQLIREDDVLKRHGHLQLDFPIDNNQIVELLHQINMQPEQYEIHIKGFFGLIRVARKKALLLASNPLYDNLILLMVMFNTMFMCSSGFINTDQAPYIYVSDFFNGIFVMDFCRKVFAYGISFFGDVMNIFDTVVVCISLVQMSVGSGNLSALRSIRILRAFRVIRITRLVRSLSYMRIVMEIISSIINQFVYVLLLLTLFIFIYTLLGMQIFGGSFVSPLVTGIRQDYNTFFNALFIIVQVMTVQNWNDIQTMSITSSCGKWSVVFVVSWIFIGNWILLNLLQAILLDGFDDDATDQEQELTEDSNMSEDAPVKYQQQEQLLPEEDLSSQQKTQMATTNKMIQYDGEDASLFIFRGDNPIRKIAIALTQSTIFEVIVFMTILFSSAKLAIDTYVTPDSSQTMATFSTISDYIINFIFIFECFVKIIALGLVVGQNAYLKSSWNKLDFFIVMTSIIDMSLSGVNLSIIKLMRTVRPLRIITKNEDMKIIVSSLLSSFVGLCNVLIICLCVFLMFAILGMNLLQGKLNFCNVTGDKLVIGQYGPYNINSTQCAAQNGTWTTEVINFQNIGSSMVSLYVFSTFQNWPFYAYTFIDASDNGPVLNSNQILYFIYCVIFIFVACYFFFDMLIGVMFMNYHIQEQRIRPQKLSDKQINWQNLQKIIVSEDPCFQLYLCPDSPIRKFFFSIVSAGWFQIVIALVIIFNIVVMAITNDDITSSESETLSTLNLICSIIFIGEFTLKFISYRKAYFLSAWNVFDFFVVSASVLDISLHYFGVNSGQSSTLSILPQIARIFRVMRITRLLRMFKSFKGLQKLIQTFLFSLPAIGKGLSLYFLYLFISAILASYLMGDITYDYTGNMNSVLNYRHFHNAFQLLFVNLTGQNWYYYMFYSTQPGYVACSTESCSSFFNYLFWIPYQFLGQNVFLQLFALIVLDEFQANYINEHNPLGIFSIFEEDFRQNWIAITEKYHSQKIETKRLVDLMLLLRPPLGLGRLETINKYRSQLQLNDKITPQQIEEKVTEFDKKLKRNAAKLIHKMNIMKNRIYFGYHQTFYNFAKLATLPDVINNATAEQKDLLDQLHHQSDEALEKIRPKGNLFFYDELEGNEESNVPLNPISLILFTQMIVKSWHNYSQKTIAKKELKELKDKKNQYFDSLNNSCASDLDQAKYQKIPIQRKMAIRRGGLIENKCATGQKVCEFKPIPNMMVAYGEGKRAKNRLSIKRAKKHSSAISDGLNRISLSIARPSDQ